MAYSNDIDYMSLIQKAASEGDFATAAALEATRNEKIKGEGLNYTPTSDYSNYLGKNEYQPVGSTANGGTDWSTVINNLMSSGASSDEVGSALQSRINKATSTPGLGQYAYDDVYNNAMSYIDANKQDDTFDSLLDSIINRKDFSYDPTQDPSYQAYATQYTNQGKKAMRDTLGEAAALTGGIPSSAAIAAADQVNNDYMSQLSGVIPTLEEQSYGRYQDDLSNNLDALSLLSSLKSDDNTTPSTSGSSGGSSGSSSGSGSGSDSSSSLFDDMKASGNPYTYLTTNYKKYGVAYAGLAGVYSEYQDWLDSQGSSSGDTIYIPGFGNVTYDKAEELEKAGRIFMTGIDENGDPVYRVVMQGH